MKKIVKEENKNTSELWFNWLTRKLNSYEAFKDFASGQNPEDVAENFVAINSLGTVSYTHLTLPTKRIV